MSNESLTAELIRSKALRSPSLIEAFLSVDRGDFVPEQFKDHAYEDKPLPLLDGSTISQPTTVAIMLELLAPQQNQKILDVGAGSGWTTSLLSECVGEKGKVIGVEISPGVLEFGQKNLAKYNYKNIEIKKALTTLGFTEEAPFDRILVSAASENFPHELSAQLAVGGIMVVPIQHSIYKVIRISEDQVDATEFPGFSFVPLK